MRYVSSDATLKNGELRRRDTCIFHIYVLTTFLFLICYDCIKLPRFMLLMLLYLMS